MLNSDQPILSVDQSFTRTTSTGPSRPISSSRPAAREQPPEPGRDANAVLWQYLESGYLISVSFLDGVYLIDIETARMSPLT